jgi:hypothetical protein
MPKAKSKAKTQRKEKRDFAQTAHSVFQKTTGVKGRNQSVQRSQSRSGRGK